VDEDGWRWKEWMWIEVGRDRDRDEKKWIHTQTDSLAALTALQYLISMHAVHDSSLPLGCPSVTQRGDPQ
jgi:hypothetical protein